MTQLCALCRTAAELERSHIIPEFLYRPLYEEGAAVELNITGGTEAPRRQGYTERLLCRQCEARFSALESYFANVWHNPVKRIRPSVLDEGMLVIAGLDYDRFKLFHMSLLWRMGVSTISPFSNVRLGTRGEYLRQMLLADDPGDPDDFALFGLGLRDPDTNGWQDQIVHAPRAARVDGQWIFTVLFYGVRWHYFASKHVSGRSIPAVFTREGNLPLLIRNWTSDPHLQEAAPFIPSLVPKKKQRQSGRAGS